MNAADMLVVACGSAAAGAMWGWLAGLAGTPARWSLRVVAALLVATGVFAGEVGMLTAGRWASVFVAAAGASLLVHVVWRSRLGRRYGRPLPRGGE